MRARPLRIVVYGVLILVGIVALAARLAPPIEVEEADRDVTIAAMDATLASLRSQTVEKGPLVVVLGDSSLGWHPPLGPDESLTRMLEREGSRAGVTIRVVQHDGFDAVAYYLLVDELAALHPAAVVLTANLQSFTDDWFRRTRMKHPQLAAFIRPSRVPRAMRLPLDLAGISDASLVVKPVFRALGASDVPEQIDGYRTQIRDGLDEWLKSSAKRAMTGGGVAFAEPPPALPGAPGMVPPAPASAPPAPALAPQTPALAAPAPALAPPAPALAPPAPAMAPQAPAVAPPAPALVPPAPATAPPAPKIPPMIPLPGVIPGKNARRPPAAPGAPLLAKGAFRFMDLYPSNLDVDQSTVRVFAATVRDLVARGVRTVVYLAPLHLQAAQVTGAYTERNLPRAETVVREMTTGNGGHFVDLAESLPQESYFVDRYTHFTADGNRIVLDGLLAELGRIVGPGAAAPP